MVSGEVSYRRYLRSGNCGSLCGPYRLQRMLKWTEWKYTSGMLKPLEDPVTTKSGCLLPAHTSQDPSTRCRKSVKLALQSSRPQKAHAGVKGQRKNLNRQLDIFRKYGRNGLSSEQNTRKTVVRFDGLTLQLVHRAKTEQGAIHIMV